MSDEWFPPRKVKQVRPEESVKEVLDTAASVGWDLRPHLTPDAPEIKLEPLERGRYRLFSWYSKESVVLTAGDLLDLARWVEQHRETLENEP